MSDPDPHRLPEFAHQLAALVARMSQEDRDFVGRRVRIRVATSDGETKRQPRKRRRHGGGRGRTQTRTYDRARLPAGFDLSKASPLSASHRQTGHVRLPYFDMSRVNKRIVPKSATGATHPRYPATNGGAGAHVDYLCNGAEMSQRSHLDYIIRSNALGLCDLIDAEADRVEANETAIYTNIEGDTARIRSLFEAAEAYEREPKQNHLTTLSEHASAWAEIAARDGADTWIVEANQRLQSEIARAKDDRSKRGKSEPSKPWTIKIATVDHEQAFDRLTRWDEVGLPPELLNFQQGRTGRVQIRFVAELPANSTSQERRQILERFCQAYADKGCMVVGAIHRPDPHNNHGNWHMHVDVYDRPAEWLDEHQCWDFAYKAKDRWGRWHHPYAQNKIASLTRSAKGEAHFSYGRTLLKEERARLVSILNDTSAAISTRYVTGTYADNGIALTPTKKLGTRNSALEEKGVVTTVGLSNAHIVFGDRFAAAQREFRRKEREIRRRAKDAALASLAVGRGPSIAPIKASSERLIELHERLKEMIDFETVRDMAASRAETVLRTLASKSGLARIKRCTAGELAAMAGAAEERLADIATVVPPESCRDRRRRRLEARIETEEATFDGLIETVSDRMQAAQHFLDMDPPAGQRPTSGGYVELRERRLLHWLARHGGDSAVLIFDERGDFRLGQGVPRAVRTLFGDLYNGSAIQQQLRVAWHGQLASSKAAGASNATQPQVEPPVSTDVGTGGSVSTAASPLHSGAVHDSGTDKPADSVETRRKYGIAEQAGRLRTEARPLNQLIRGGPQSRAKVEVRADTTMPAPRIKGDRDEDRSIQPSPAPSRPSVTGGIRKLAEAVRDQRPGEARPEAMPKGSTGPHTGSRPIPSSPGSSRRGQSER